MAKIINIRELRPGMVILGIVEQNGPVKIRKSGLVTSDAMVTGLREMGVLQLDIDPEQEVELAAEAGDDEKASLSETQKLLASQRRQASDHQISDQFHRSLFLPSVQDLPSPWRYYARKGSVLALALTIGIGLGWLGATAPAYWQAMLVSESTQSNNPSSPPIEESDTETRSTTSASSDNKPSGESRPTAEPSQTVADTPTNTGSDATSSNPQNASGDKARIANVNNEPTQPIANAPEFDSAATRTETTPSNVSEDEPLPSSGVNNESISPELLAKFREAVSAIDPNQDPEPMPEPTIDSEMDVVKVHQLPAWLMTELPTMQFSQHMYASDKSKRWVTVNGERLSEGDEITSGLRVFRIEPQHVILAYKGHQFSMPALTDW